MPIRCLNCSFNLDEKWLLYRTRIQQNGHRTYIRVLILNKLEKSDHVRTAKVIDCLQASEHAAIRDALEMILTDVLYNKKTTKTQIRLTSTWPPLINFTSCANLCTPLTSIVVRRSNLWKNCVIKMCTSNTCVTSLRSTSRNTSINHSKCRCEGQIQRKYTWIMNKIN